MVGCAADPYITKAAGLLGAEPDVAIEGTRGYPYLTTRAAELGWLTGSIGTSAGSKLVTHLKLVGDVLVAQSRLTVSRTRSR